MQTVKMAKIIDVYMVGLEELNSAISAEDMSGEEGKAPCGMQMIAHLKWLLIDMQNRLNKGQWYNLSHDLRFIQGATCGRLDFSLKELDEQLEVFRRI